jgi:hypothetical protein
LNNLLVKNNFRYLYIDSGFKKWLNFDDLWLSCQFEQDRYLKGMKLLTWQAKWIIGWDGMAQ